MNGYHDLSGKRLALVESMLHDAFYDGIRRARALGLEVWLLLRDRDWYAPAHRWHDHPLTRVDRLIDVDTHDLAAVLAVLTDRAGAPLVDGVTSFSDYHTALAAEAARWLGLPEPGVEAVATANQKDALRDRLAGRAYHVRHRLVTDGAQLPKAADEIGFPLIAKPPAEAISFGVRLVTSCSELERAYAELAAVRRSLRGQPRPGHVLLEEYVPGVEVSVESFTVDNRTHFYGVTSKDLLPPPSFIERAHSFPVRLPTRQWRQVRDMVTDTLTELGLRQGPAHTELKLTPDGPKLIEVNPRLPAHCITTMVRDVCGLDPHLDAKLVAVGGRVEPFDVDQRGGAAVVVLYPERPGLLDRVDGVAEAGQVGQVGQVRITLHAEPGQPVGARPDNSASVGFVYARAGTAGGALATAELAAKHITIQVREG